MKRFFNIEPDYDTSIIPEDIRISAQVWYIQKSVKILMSINILFLIVVFLLSISTENIFFLQLIAAGIIIVSLIMIISSSYLINHSAEISLNKRWVMKKFLTQHIYLPKNTVISKYDLVRYYELLQKL